MIPLDDAAHTAIAILGLLANNVPSFIELPLVLIAPRRRDLIIRVRDKPPTTVGPCATAQNSYKATLSECFN